MSAGNENLTIARKEHISNNMQYRSYMQRNGNSIQSYNFSIAQSETASMLANNSYDSIVGPPHLYSTCTAPETIKYTSSDLKDWYFAAGNV